MKKISQFVMNYSIPIIVVVVLVTVFLGYHAAQIDIEAGIKDMLPKDNPVVEKFDQVSEMFGGMAYAVVILEDKDIIDQGSLQKIDEMTRQFENLEGVEEVTSLTTIKNIKGTFTGIEVKKFVDKVPDSKEEIAKLKEDLRGEEQYMGSIVNEDFTSSTMLVKIKHNVEEPESVVRDIQEVVAEHRGPEKMYTTGSPVMVTDATDSMKKDLGRLLPFIIAIVMLILWISFRSFRGVFIPLSTVLISVIWAIGGLSLLGKSLSLVSTVLPVLLVSVGSAYAIHITARYYEELHSGKDLEKAISNTIRKVGIAVIMAGGTTMAGFGSLFFSKLVIIQDFALATAFGVGVALLVSVLFAPAVLLRLSKPNHLKAAEERTISTNFFKGLFDIVLNHRAIIITLALVLAIGSVLVIPRLKPETNYISYFKKGSEPRVAAELADQRFGGSLSLDVVVHGSIKNPDLLKRMRDFQDEAEKISGLNKPLSMVTIFREENLALNNNDQSKKVIPTNKNQIAQYLLLLNMSDKNFTNDFLTFDQKKSRIQFRMINMSSQQQEKILNQFHKLVDKHFAGKYKVDVTGVPVMANEVTNMVISSQIRSLIASIVFTFIITSLLLRSAKRGLFCSLPIALTVLINFGIMGWFGISLDIATTMIASIAVGIGVDYSIHIYTRYLEEKEDGSNPVEALKRAVYTVGRANLYNAITVIAGFCVILLSSFPPLINFGGLTAITMVISFFGAVLILPTLIMSTIKIKEKAQNIGLNNN